MRTEDETTTPNPREVTETLAVRHGDGDVGGETSHGGGTGADGDAAYVELDAEQAHGDRRGEPDIEAGHLGG